MAKQEGRVSVNAIIKELFGTRQLRPDDFLFMNLIKAKGTKHKHSITKQPSSGLNLYNIEKSKNIKKSEDLIKKSYVKYIIECLLTQMEIMYSAFMKEFDIGCFPINIFIWSPDEFLFRVAQENVVYLDVIKRSLSNQELEVYKFKTDIREIIKFSKRILSEFFSEKVSESLLMTLTDYKENFDFDAILLKQFNNSIKRRTAHVESMQTYSESRESKRVSTSAVLKEMKWNLDNLAPIEQRYTSKWYENLTLQSQLEDEIALNNLLKEKAELDKKVNDDAYAFKCRMDMYYTLITSYKLRLDDLKNTYEVDLEQIDNQVIISKLNVAKVYEELKHYQDQVEMFKRKIAKKLEVINTPDVRKTVSTLKSYKMKRRNKGKKKN